MNAPRPGIRANASLALLIAIAPGTAALVSQVGDDEVWYDPGTYSYYFGHATQGGSAEAIGVVNAATEEFVTSIPMEGSGVHSVAVNAKNGHIFVPVNGKGIFVIAPGK